MLESSNYQIVRLVICCATLNHAELAEPRNTRSTISCSMIFNYINSQEEDPGYEELKINLEI